MLLVFRALVSIITAAKMSDHIYWLASNDAGNSDHVQRTLHNLSKQQARLRRRISKLTRKRYSSCADDEELQRQRATCNLLGVPKFG